MEISLLDMKLKLNLCLSKIKSRLIKNLKIYLQKTKIDKAERDLILEIYLRLKIL